MSELLAATTLAPVVVNRSSSVHAGTFELVMRNGMALRIPSDFDDAALTRLVTLLGQHVMLTPRTGIYAATSPVDLRAFDGLAAAARSADVIDSAVDAGT